MQRHELLELMATLQLSGMRTAFDEVVADGLRRQHTFHQMFGALLQAEVAEKRARSIRYQMGAARLPLAKTVEDFRFAGTPINEALVRDLHAGGFLATQRNAVFVGGTGAEKRISRWPSSPTASATVPAAGSSPPSIWPTGSRRRAVPARPEPWPANSPVSIWWCSMNSATCRSRRAAVSSCST